MTGILQPDRPEKVFVLILHQGRGQDGSLHGLDEWTRGSWRCGDVGDDSLLRSGSTFCNGNCEWVHDGGRRWRVPISRLGTLTMHDAAIHGSCGGDWHSTAVH